MTKNSDENYILLILILHIVNINVNNTYSRLLIQSKFAQDRFVYHVSVNLIGKFQFLSIEAFFAQETTSGKYISHYFPSAPNLLHSLLSATGEAPELLNSVWGGNNWKGESGSGNRHFDFAGVQIAISDHH